jgi:hypothetical protein
MFHLQCVICQKLAVVKLLKIFEKKKTMKIFQLLDVF